MKKIRYSAVQPSGASYTVVGVDACRGGWLAVGFQAVPKTNHLGEKAQRLLWDIDLFESIEALWFPNRKANVILIDMPIGLMEKGPEERFCDLLARRRLGGRGSSVYRVPVRRAAYARRYRKACRINEKRTGKKLSRQSWGIIPKIQELDNFLKRNPSARGRMRESHPEICFAALSEGRGQHHGKKTEEGYRERLALLQKFFPEVDAVIAAAERGFPRKSAGRDDVLDALVLAVTAWVCKAAQKGDAGDGSAIAASSGPRGMWSLGRIPDPPPLDSRGLPMEIVYPERAPASL